MQIIRHEKKENLHIQPKKFGCMKTVFAIWELATEYLYYSLSMIQVYIAYRVLYLILGNSRKKLCYVTLVTISEEDTNAMEHGLSWPCCFRRPWGCTAFLFVLLSVSCLTWSEKESRIILTGFFKLKKDCLWVWPAFHGFVNTFVPKILVV